MSKKDQELVYRYFPKNGILYQPGLGKIFGVNAGIILSQLLFWNGKGKDKEGWVYKTEIEMEQETGLSRTRQDSGISQLKKMTILETKLAGIPAKRHFRLDVEKLIDMLPSLKETYKLEYPNPPRLIVEKQQSITKNTQKTTSKNTTRIYKNDYMLAKRQLCDARNIKAIDENS